MSVISKNNLRMQIISDMFYLENPLQVMRKVDFSSVEISKNYFVVYLLGTKATQRHLTDDAII